MLHVHVSCILLGLAMSKANCVVMNQERFLKDLKDFQDV